jgi:hypothetical protein
MKTAPTAAFETLLGLPVLAKFKCILSALFRLKHYFVNFSFSLTEIFTFFLQREPKCKFPARKSPNT